MLAVTALSALGSTGYGLLAPAVVELADDYRVSVATVGLLQTAVAVPGIVLTMVLGGLSDRLGRGRVALACLALFSITGTACVFVESFGVAVALRAAQGVGLAGLLTIPPTVIGEQLTGSARSRWLAINTMMLTSASIVSPVLGGVLAGTGNPRNAFWAYTAGLLVAPSTVLVLGLGPGRRAAERGDPRAVIAGLRRLGTVWTTAGVLAVSVTTMVYMTGTMTTLLPVALDQVFDVPVSLRGIFVGLGNVGSVIASGILALVAGRLGDRFQMIGGLSVISGALVLLSTAGSLWVVVPAMLLLGTGVSSTYNACVNYMARQNVPGRGVLVGAWSAASRLGQAIGPLAAAGLLALAAPMPAIATAGVIGFAVVLGLILAVRSRSHRMFRS
jgi:ACDE family multidrug resistance protein